MSTIELVGICKRYHDFTAVAPTDLRIEQGELVALLGPSGSGKSTILSMIAGLVAPTEGTVHIGGRDITHVPPAQRNLGMVFQSYALFPHMSVYDNIAFPLSIRGVPKRDIAGRVAKALAQVRLSGLERRRPSELSGGQQQRVALGRALVFEPEILLLDEPMGALDKNLREEVQLELRQLQRELGVTTVLVTHDQEEALSLSTRLVVLDRGRIQQVDSPSEAYRRPCNRFVAQFIGTANLFAGMVAADGTGATVTLADGTRLGCFDRGGKSGAADIVVRPEHIRLQPPDAPGGIAAQVEESVYLGQSSRLHLRMAEGALVVAQVQQQTRAFAPGERLRIAWEAENAWPMFR